MAMPPASTTMEIQWKGQSYTLEKPSFLGEGTRLSRESLRRMFQKVCRKGNFDTAIQSCRDGELKGKLLQVKEITLDCIAHLRTTEVDSFQPKTLRSNMEDPGGVYGIAIRVWSCDNPNRVVGIKIKYGTSFKCYDRSSEQPGSFCFLMKGRKELVGLIPDDFVDKIEALELPGLVFHPDHKERSRDTIRMQLYEGYLAVIHESDCITNTIFERFVQLPPHLHLVPTDKTVEARAKHFLRDLQQAGAFGLFTWATIKSIVYNMAKQHHREFIGTRLREAPDGGDFLKPSLIQTLFDESFLGWEDVVKDPPRQRTLKRLVQQLDSLVEDDGTEATVESIRKAFKAITGENKDPYVHPEPKELADGFIQTFSKKDDELPKNVYFYVEAWTLQATKDVYPAWYNETIASAGETIDMADAVPDLAKYGSKQQLIQTPGGRRLITTSSLFQAFFSKTQTHVKTPCVVELIAQLELFGRVGLHNPEYVAHRCAIFKSYLMALTFGSDDDQPANDDEEEEEEEGECHRFSAARAALPAGYLLGPMKNNKTVSDNILSGINVHDMHFLYFQLGESKFNKLLKLVGLLKTQTISPLSPKWKCEGVPASRNIPAQACTNSSSSPYACLIGKKQGPGVHPYWGNWYCRGTCCRKMERRERDELAGMEVVSESQQERLNSLEAQTRTNQRNRQVAEHGKEVVRQKERTRERANGEASQASRKRRSEYNKQRDAKRQDTKASGDRGWYSSKDPYPEDFMRKLDRASILFWQYMGPNAADTYRPNLINLYICLLEAEEENLDDEYTDRKTKKGRLMYRKGVIDKIVEKHYEKASGNNRIQPNNDTLSRIKTNQYKQLGLKLEVIYQKIVAAVCTTL